MKNDLRSCIDLEPVFILGAGAFGTAMAQILSFHRPVTIWTRNCSVVNEINEHHTNSQYLPSIQLNSNIFATTNLTPPCGIIVISLPSFAVIDVISFLPQGKYHFLITTKGLNPFTGETLHQTFAKLFSRNTTAVLYGPNFANELANGHISVAVLGCETSNRELYFDLFTHTNLHLTHTTDMIGVQMASTYKHMAAMGTGICDALCDTNTTCYNLKASVLYIYWRELRNIIHAYGGNIESAYLESILGDLFVSCSYRSRNHRLGFLSVNDPLCEEFNTLRQMCEGPYAINSIIKKIGNSSNPLFLKFLQDLIQNPGPRNKSSLLSHIDKMLNHYRLGEHKSFKS